MNDEPKNILEQLKHAQFLKEEHKFDAWDTKTPADEFQYPPHPEIVTQPPHIAFTGLLVWALPPVLFVCFIVGVLWLTYADIATYHFTITPVVLP